MKRYRNSDDRTKRRVVGRKNEPDNKRLPVTNVFVNTGDALIVTSDQCSDTGACVLTVFDTEGSDNPEWEQRHDEDVPVPGSRVAP